MQPIMWLVNPFSYASSSDKSKQGPTTGAGDPHENHYGQSAYRVVVTITNLRKGQIFSPPVVVSHRPGFRLFEPGQVASDAIMPGQSASLELDVTRSWSELSLGGTLVSTNDAFLALNGESIPRTGGRILCCPGNGGDSIGVRIKVLL